MARPRNTLVLTLPPDPELKPLTRLVSTHFLRQNGANAATARRGARAVEKRCGALLRAAARLREDSPARFVLLLRRETDNLAVFGRTVEGAETCLLRLTLPDSA